MRSCVTELLGAGITAAAARCNVTKKAEVERLVAWTAATYGAVDILVANAGAGEPLLMGLSPLSLSLPGRGQSASHHSLIDVFSPSLLLCRAA